MTMTHRIHGAARYGNIYHQYTPVMLAYNSIYTMDPMGEGNRAESGDDIRQIPSAHPIA